MNLSDALEKLKMDMPITASVVVAEIERLTAENERLRALLKECADDLEIEIGHRYPLSSGDVPGRDVYPDMQRRFERDMAPVLAARRALHQQQAVNSEEGK